MIMRKPIQVCSACEHIEPKEETAFPNFQDVLKFNDRFNELKDHLQKFYNVQREFKEVLKSNLDLLESFPHPEENRKKSDEQKKYLFEKMKEIESYLIDNVIKMYCSM
jgi:vacuolar-type H+-ATPase subunit B/Vma2